MSVFVLEKLMARFDSDVLHVHSEFGDDTALVRPSCWYQAASFLKEDPALDFDMFIDLCAVDFPERGSTNERFEIVLHLRSLSKTHRIRMKTRVGDDEGHGAAVASLVSLWAGANWFEREAYDMFGIQFSGHPDLRRILLYPEFVGHPLRKDYPAEKSQPLVPYRTEAEAGLPLEKLPPFGGDEGMSFGRKDWSTLQDLD